MNKKNLTLLGILIILVGAAYLYQGPLKAWQRDLGKPKNFLASLNVDQVAAIDVVKQGATTTIEMSGDKWKIGGTKAFYVPAETITAAKTALSAAKDSALTVASENPDKKGEFDLDGDSATLVVLRQGENVMQRLLVGKTGSDYQSSYIALENDPTTFLVGANLTNAFARADFYDRTIMQSDREKASKIRFQYPTREFTIEKKDGKWSGTLPTKFIVNEDKVNEVLNVMTALRAAEIPPQTFAGTGLEKNSIIVQITGEGIDQTLMVGDAQGEGEDALYFAKRGDSDNIYLITKSERDILNKKFSDLK